MKFWPFPIIRNYPKSSDVDQLFCRFIDAGPFSFVAVDEYETTVSCEAGTLKFWSANRFYAYAQRGELTHPSGKRESWANEMPSRAAVRRMFKKLQGKNRFLPEVQP